jgi:uncharacterized membrane protein HdeD (DUF308 family)
MSAAASMLRGGRPLLYTLSKNWWLMLLRGVSAIAFGVVALVLPGLSLLTLVVLYGAFAMADGILALFTAIRGEKGTPRLWLTFTGFLGVGVGIMTFVWPAITATVLLLIIAFWSIAMGLGQIVGAMRLRKELKNEWFLALAGALLVVFGVVLLFQPAAGALALVLFIGIDAIIYGVLLVFLALKLRIHGDKPTAHTGDGVHA